jgi:hypothetical protein
MRTHIATIFIVLGTAFAGQNQTPANDQKLTARQMYYGEQDEPPAKPAVKPSKPKSAKPGAKANEQATTGKPAAAPESTVVKASYTAKPLGLRYTLWKRNGDQKAAVSPDTAFHSGDRIQVGVEVNDAGYLYILSQGTSGAWTTLFPSAQVEDGNNRVESGHLYTVPPGHVITFTGETGEEKLFVIFSRQPEPDMERLIYSLQGSQKAATPEPGKNESEHKVLVATAGPVDDALVERMRQVYARDLIVEADTADEPQPGAKATKAMYVVNPKGASDSRVVASIALMHR